MSPLPLASTSKYFQPKETTGSENHYPSRVRRICRKQTFVPLQPLKIDMFKYIYLVTFDRSKQPGEGTTAPQEFIGFAEFDNLSLFKDHDPVII